MAASLILALFCLSLFESIGARRWNNTGKGTIIFEEAWTLPGLLWQQNLPIPGTQPNNPHNKLAANLLDIHNQRLAQMDETGVDFMVLSCASPCTQGISDPVAAAQMAVDVNNQLADLISNNTIRFGAFATLSMHDPATAAQELKRSVKELGFLGALLNDYQQSGADNMTLLYFDQPEYDVFWETVTELDVPVYFHPRTGIDILTNLQYAHAIWLNGSPQEFAVSLSNHILGLCTNGVFDRFPKLKIIVGHLGERIPSDLFRIDEQIAINNPPGTIPMLRNVSSYWRTNLFETTSGNFATPLLQFHIDQIGVDRILYSVDYPYVQMTEGAAWVNNLPMNKEELLALKRGRAIELLGLDK